MVGDGPRRCRMPAPASQAERGQLVAQRRRAPQSAAGCGAEIEPRRLRRSGTTASAAAARPSRGTSRPSDRSAPWSARNSSSVMPSGPPPRLSITGELASAPKRSGRMRHLGTSVTPFWWPNGRWHGNARPTSQSSSTGSCEPTTSCSVRSCGMRGGVTAIQCWGARSSSVATSRTWVASRGIAASGARRLRHAGAAPTSAKPMPPPAGSAACSSVAHWTMTSPGSKRPAAATTSSGPA